ncbi:aldehyde dehydrogenase family protein [Parvicella tangerina]|uniref:Sulfoacetaldehyde dehydrogenase n=1 Tax=Parvicella tangerina TaxID=2829795 RepID=A0A916JKS8_9FLAO|nr:aldehyde dehydrogenase family protein [Parvicella tangerina]CAG5079450.1 Sulfoacetaldehyde dehydrogenase [Parvicella tangerina]
MKVLDKYSNKTIGTIDLDDRIIIEQKLQQATDFYQNYKLSDSQTRKKYIEVIISCLKAHKNKLVELISQETGKPIFYAKSELDRSIRTAELGLKYFNKTAIQELDIDLKDTSFKESFYRRFPVGIVFGISPFNFPLNLALHKIIPAIASGNVILIKPSPYTPLTLDFLVKEINQTVPKGLVTITHCSNENAEFIVKHPKTNLISFTGSDQVGWHIKSLVPKKKVILELGGNAAVYIDESAELTGLATKIAKATTLFAGQICISTQRIFVHEHIYEDFKEALIAAFKQVTSGNPIDNVTNSPLIDEVHLRRLLDWIKEAEDSGGKILVGGQAQSTQPPILAPTLIEGGSSSIKLFTEEAFGPVGVLNAVRDYEAGAYQINNSKYGLQAGVFTTSAKVKDYMFDHLDVGGVIINGIPGFRKDEMPYGGIKDSGFGREGILYAMEEMTEIKLCIR